MEELRTTEVLEREILEDARKKAYKILKTADDTLTAQTLDWEKKISEAIASARKTYETRQKKGNEEIFARFPLDKRRQRSETFEGFLVRAMDDFLRSLKREDVLLLLKLILLERLEAGETGRCHKAEVQYSGISLSEAKQVLGNALPPDVSFTELKDITRIHDPAFSGFPFIEVNAGAVRVTASVKAAADELLKERRAELSSALLGEGVLND